MATITWIGAACIDCAIIDANGDHHDDAALDAYAAGMADYPAGAVLVVDPGDGSMAVDPCMVCGTTTPGDRYVARVDA